MLLQYFMHSYLRYANALQNYYHKYTENFEFVPEGGYNPQWAFGAGLSYTKFSYANLKLSTAVMDTGTPVKITVEVKNTGNLAGKETVLLYVSDLVASSNS